MPEIPSTAPQSSVPLADKLDSLINRSGLIASWAYALLVVVIIVQVTLRYGFSNGLVILEELQWHLYAIGVMFGMSYGLTHNVHIRVDLLHMRFGPTTKSVVEIFGILFLLMPFIVIVMIHSVDFVSDSWRINEHSNAPSGLPWRWAIKSVIPLCFGLLFISACSRLLRECTLLLRKESAED